MAPRAKEVRQPEGALCESCVMFEGWAEGGRSPRGVKLARCRAIGASVQPPYDRCPAYKPRAST
ncbi:hypothetical protein B6U99_04220 [Candidatus Geothermarchaeota archaeon ex4572_27]|nr:MAG: hypothetical protein B6U99_04220 [Candidatus Geothermarchaeota archaeon ex4572_27]